jgi:bifunctional non-homologous end joining protein LigD
MEERKNARGERVFVDTNRNAYAQLIAPACAVRARRGAPVSTPIDWSELAANDLRPDGVTIQNIFSRLKRTEDPWKNFWLQVASLDEARRKLKSA